ncbi:MAG: stage II sporulation protein M [Fimbriimonadaceae bacterium]|nr:stage II sporulation protein M [Fimbriimonadaceae bacterium]
MTEEILIRQRMPAWKELEELTTKADVTFRKLSPEQILRFVKLYRQAAGDLAFLSARPTNPDVVQYLNATVARAYGLLYRKPREGLLGSINAALRTSARTMRKNWGFVAVAAGIFFAGLMGSFFLMGISSDFREFFVPPEFEESFEGWKSGAHEGRSGDESVGASFFYATNNPTVGIVTTAGGLASFGLLTVYSMWQNGTVMGSLLYETNQVGTAGFVLVSVYPHGVPEIGGIFVTAAAGLMLGWALILPGNRSRTQALREQGKEAFIVLVTGLVMIFMAAPIEGFFSFNPAVPHWLRIVVGTGLLIGFAYFFATYGRSESANAIGERNQVQPTLPHSGPKS